MWPWRPLPALSCPFCRCSSACPCRVLNLEKCVGQSQSMIVVVDVVHPSAVVPVPFRPAWGICTTCSKLGERSLFLKLRVLTTRSVI